MIAYKAFNKNMICRDFQYEEGKIYEIKEDPILCEKGFHFCKDLVLTLLYYPINNCIAENKYAEVKVLGKTEFEKPNYHKGVTNKIKIIRILSDKEVLKLVDNNKNSGHYNSGNYNSGNYNSGKYNSGNYNSGNYNSGYKNSGYNNSGYNNSGYNNSGNYNLKNYNSGDYNSGNYNSGYKNSGDKNSGNYNSGYKNSGDKNSGNYNSGDYNSCNNESGFFNSKQNKKIRVFNTFVDKKKWDSAIKPCFINFSLKEGKTYKECFIESYNNTSIEDQNKIYNLPNFNAEVFYEISGIDLRDKNDYSF